MLTDKTRIEFEKWYYKKIHFVGLCDIEEHLDQTIYALIIEWFDSIGIYISVPSFNDTGLGYQRGFESLVYNEKTNQIFEQYNDNDVFNSRQEATKKAIEKANEIYNI